LQLRKEDGVKISVQLKRERSSEWHNRRCH